MIDLHCHTTVSDGLVTPTDIIRLASREGITSFAISDHDSVDGLDEAIQSAAALGLHFTPAIELSVNFPGASFHLLGYGIDHKNQDLLDQIAFFKSSRETRIARIVKKLNEAGTALTLEEVQAESREATPGRPHVARALVRKGHAPDPASAVKRYLVKGTPGYVGKEKIAPRAAFELIKQAGGIPVLAHPKSLKCESREDYERVVESFIQLGLAGIEVYSPKHTTADVTLFTGLAEQHNLFITGGSDFHGELGDRLGYYGGNRLIPEDCGRALFQAMNRS